ncbi:GNAT family N-acetyltransferase [Streptomyces sp. NPDC006923]|uniref:GNAT family N-acetyltransferase n=1 Tax=Streptomyces sp. NPDC006923 TaxID=3155355 RepID=UPI0033C30E77
MDHQAVLAQFDRETREQARADSPGARVERVGGVVRQVGAADDWNGILWSDLDGTTAAAAIAAQVEYFTALGREFEWKLYAHDRPGDLAGRLLSAGFTSGPTEALMVADIGELRPAGEPPGGVRLLPVTDAAGVDLVVDVHEQAFGTDGGRLRQRLLNQLSGAPDTFSAVVAMAGERPVSAARMELVPGTPFAGLWGGGTVRDWRGRGVYRALIAHRARIAAAHGCRFLQVDASDESRPILRRLGFASLSTTTPYLYEP